MTKPQTPERIELPGGYYIGEEHSVGSFYVYDGNNRPIGSLDYGCTEAFAAAMRPVEASPLPGDDEAMEKAYDDFGVSIGGFTMENEKWHDMLSDEVFKAGFKAGLRHREQATAPLREALGGQWHGLFLDGRNEHGTHVLSLPSRSRMDEQNEGDLAWQAEDIFKACENEGHKAGQGVVCFFKFVPYDDHGKGAWEFSHYSAELTAALYGTAKEQEEDEALAAHPTKAG